MREISLAKVACAKILAMAVLAVKREMYYEEDGHELTYQYGYTGNIVQFICYVSAIHLDGERYIPLDRALISSKSRVSYYNLYMISMAKRFTLYHCSQRVWIIEMLTL